MYTSPWAGFEVTTLVAIYTDCIGSGKSNNHTIRTTTALKDFRREDSNTNFTYRW